jgi:hypothetical protein
MLMSQQARMERPVSVTKQSDEDTVLGPGKAGPANTDNDP